MIIMAVAVIPTFIVLVAAVIVPPVISGESRSYSYTADHCS
jgi:hypothetical protein